LNRAVLFALPALFGACSSKPSAGTTTLVVRVTDGATP